MGPQAWSSARWNSPAGVFSSRFRMRSARSALRDAAAATAQFRVCGRTEGTAERASRFRPAMDRSEGSLGAGRAGKSSVDSRVRWPREREREREAMAVRFK